MQFEEKTNWIALLLSTIDLFKGY